MSEFKDTVNRWVTIGLFEELAGPNKSFIKFTLDEARKLFIECNDITGYAFATKHLGGWMHWKALESSRPVMEQIEAWIAELEAKKRAEALLRIEQSSSEGHFQANKFIVDRGWEKRKAGTPSKDEMEKERDREKRLQKNVASFLKPVKA